MITIGKIEELGPILDALDTRLKTLEAYVKANDQRITALEVGRIAAVEHAIAEHQAGAETRLAQIRELEAQVRKATWRMAHQRNR